MTSTASPDVSAASDPSDRLLAGLTAEQRHAVTVEASPLLVLAGAGSGKTRVLTRRIAWQAAHDHIDPRRVLAVTFTRKAAAELRRRLADLGVHEQLTAGTFHALALAQLRRRWLDLGRRPPQLLDRKGRVLAPLLGPDARHLVTPVAREIEWAQARLVDPDAYPAAVRQAARTPPLDAARTAEVYAAYLREKRSRGLVDFDDLLGLLAAEIERDAEYAAAVHWRFRHVFVDEFQDVSPAQARLLHAWIGERRDLCAVGDGDQAIYGFGGADARYVRDFAHHFGADATVVELRANFRSSPQIIGAAYAVLPAGERDRASVVPAGPDGPLPVVAEQPDDTAEAAWILHQVAELHRGGVRWSSMAVLVRTNAQTGPIEAALGRAGIPVRVRSSTGLVQRPEVQASLRELRAFERDAPALPFRAHVDRLVDAARSLDALQGPGLAVVLELAAEHAAIEGDAATATSFADFVAAATRLDDASPSTDGVDLLTFHRAKGLEWPVVFVAGVEDGFVPVSHARTPAALDEERRLLHVALTRAERHLFVSWAARRTFGERSVERSASPFLDDLVPHVGTHSDGATPQAGGPGAGAGGVGEGGGPPEVLTQLAARFRNDDTTDPLHDALVQWRARRARAAGVPVNAIADDDILTAIVAHRPADEAALAALPGFGPARLARYGPEIVALVSEYAD